MFNDRDYTKDAVIKQLGLIELHSKDGSALEAGCKCIETKHLFLLEGLSEEGAGFSVSKKEREFFQGLGNLARDLRKRLEVEDFHIPNPIGVGRSHNIGVSCEARQERCIKRLKVECAGGKCNPYAVCKAAIPCS